MQIAFASTEGKEEKKGTDGTEGKEKVSNNPQVGNQASQTGDLSRENTIGQEDDLEIDQDSLEDDSLSKYNFIFYFLYKFKYDTSEPTI